MPVNRGGMLWVGATQRASIDDAPGRTKGTILTIVAGIYDPLNRSAQIGKIRLAAPAPLMWMVRQHTEEELVEHVLSVGSGSSGWVDILADGTLDEFALCPSTIPEETALWSGSTAVLDCMDRYVERVRARGGDVEDQTALAPKGGAGADAD